MARTITLMLYTNGYEDEVVQEVENYCNKEGIPYTSLGFRGKDIYDFTIEGTTADYMKLDAKYGNKVRETNYAGLGNLLDTDEKTLLKWQGILDRLYARKVDTSRINSNFCDLLHGVDKVNQLEGLKKYITDEYLVSLIDARISVLSGRESDYEEYLHVLLETDKMVTVLEQAKEGKYELKDNDIDALMKLLKHRL